MKKLAILLIASTFAIACPFLTACDGGEEEEILAPDNNENAGNGNQDKVDNTAEIVKRNESIEKQCQFEFIRYVRREICYI